MARKHVLNDPIDKIFQKFTNNAKAPSPELASETNEMTPSLTSTVEV